MFTPTLRCECAQAASDRLMRKWCIRAKKHTFLKIVTAKFEKTNKQTNKNKHTHTHTHPPTPTHTHTHTKTSYNQLRSLRRNFCDSVLIQATNPLDRIHPLHGPPFAGRASN